MKTKELAVDVSSGVGSNKMTVTVSMQIPESGWAYDEKKNSLINNDNIKASGAGFIQFTVEKEIEKFDFYKDKFENYQEIGEREIGGVTFQGRTYKRIGYEWTEYLLCKIIRKVPKGQSLKLDEIFDDIKKLPLNRAQRRNMPKNIDNPAELRDIIKGPALVVLPIAVYQ